MSWTNFFLLLGCAATTRLYQVECQHSAGRVQNAMPEVATPQYYVEPLIQQEIAFQKQLQQARQFQTPPQQQFESHPPQQSTTPKGQPIQIPLTEINPKTDRYLEFFSRNLYKAVFPRYSQTNVIYSPLALQILLAFIHIGATGRTAEQLESALYLPRNRTQSALLYQKLLSDIRSDGSQPLMANKMYYNLRLQLTNDFNNYAAEYFGSELEGTDFGAPRIVEQQVNSWVAARTQNHIPYAISANTIDPQTQAILVNAIYFKAKWLHEFSTADTFDHKFFLSSQRASIAKMMFQEGMFRYGFFPHLKASILEMPYKDSQISMLIILPQEVEGLSEVEARMRDVYLGDLADQLTPHFTSLRLPRFAMDFEMDMLEPLSAVGLKQIFSNQAELDGFFQSNQPVTVAKVQHKVHISVNEAGSEVAGASFAVFMPLSAQPSKVDFIADHPFIFAIRNRHVTFFMGHVRNV